MPSISPRQAAKQLSEKQGTAYPTLHINNIQAANDRMNSTRRLRLKLYEINAPDHVSQIDFRAAAHFAMTVTPTGTDGSTHSAIADKGNTCHIHRFDF